MRFNLVWLDGTEKYAGAGMEMSLNGLLFATKTPPNAPVFDIIMDVGSRKVRARLKTARSGTLVRAGEQWTVLGCSLSGIAADDYDALVRFLKDMPEVSNKAQAELAAIDKTDDAYRMLPMRVQQRVLESLMRLGRLDMPAANQQPLLRMTHLGSDGAKQRLAVHSRTMGPQGDPQSYDSVLLIDETGMVKVES